MKPAKPLPLLKLLLFVAILFQSFTINAQRPASNTLALVDKKMQQIPESLTTTTTDIAGFINDNFSTDAEKARAIYIWLASNIRYDVESMNRKAVYERKEELVLKPLRTHQGICENYAALFDELSQKTGLRSYVISGYTKQNGRIATLPHAWNAAQIGNKWYLFDATWGAGFVNNGRFHKKISHDYFMMQPAVAIQSHMPFDYLWQFLDYPYTSREFYSGLTQQSTSKKSFSYADTIQLWEKQDHAERLASSAYRIEKNGIANTMVADRLKFIQTEIRHENQKGTINMYNTAIVSYNDGIYSLNEYINQRNRLPANAKPGPGLLKLLDDAGRKLKESKYLTTKIMNPEPKIAKQIRELQQSLAEAEAQVRRLKAKG